MSTVPERIGKYEITQVLGQGSMGVVYKALDPHIQRPVAIKVIHKALLGDSGEARAIAARFLNEAKAVGRIAHPGVVAIYEFGEDAETAYIAMEFVNGRNLDDILAEVPIPTQEQTLHVMDGLLDALSHAHAQGVWHRDVKPANLMIAKGGQVKLTDFGIARVSDANLTQVSSMIGTPSYMSPEQFRGEGIDHRADLFASGVLLYRLLTGKRPFRGSSQEVMYKILQEDAPPPSQVTGGRSAPAFDAVVARAMAKDADDRYPSADAMRQALRDIAHGKTGLPGAGGAQATNVVAVPRPPAPAVPTAPLASPPPAAPRRDANPLLGGTVFAHASPVGSGATAITAPGWDPSELSRIERALATHVGPMARVMVRDAARSCSDSASLALAVATHIPEDARRRQFLEVAAGPHASRSGAIAHASAATPVAAPAAAPDDPLTEDFKARALQLVTRKMGPIARVIVKRAAEQSGGDRQRFVQAVLAQASDPDRTGLQRDLDAL